VGNDVGKGCGLVQDCIQVSGYGGLKYGKKTDQANH